MAQDASSVFVPVRGGISELGPLQIGRLMARIKGEQGAERSLVRVQSPITNLIASKSNIVLPNGQSLEIITRGITRKGLLEIIWQGHVGDSRHVNTLSVEGNDVRGALVIDDEEWSFTPLGDGIHLIINQGTLGADRDANDFRTQAGNRGGRGKNSDSVQRSGSSATTLPSVEEIDVMFVYTSGAKSAQSTIVADIDTYVSNINTALGSGESDDTIELNVVHTMEVTYTASITRQSFLDKLTAGTSPFGGVASARTTSGADLVIALHDTLSDGYGLAEEIFAEQSGDGFAVANLFGANHRKTVSHEIGHLIGAVHDIDTFTDGWPSYDPDNPSETVSTWDWPSHAHGITHNSRTEGTIMSVSATRVNNYSEFGAKFSDDDDMGSEGYEDVILIWNDNASTSAGLVASQPEKDPPGETLLTDLGLATIEKEWHEDINLDSDPTYDPSEVSCSECTYKWYEKDTPTGDPYFTGISTETYYDLMRWDLS